MSSHSSCTQQSSVPNSPDLQQDFNFPSSALDIFPSDPSLAMQISATGISSITPAYSPTQFSHPPPPPPPPAPSHQHQSVSTVFSAVSSARVGGAYQGPSLSPHQFSPRPTPGMLSSGLYVPQSAGLLQSRPATPSVGTMQQPAFSTSCFRLTHPHQSSVYSWVGHRQPSMGASCSFARGTQYYQTNFPEYPFPPGDFAGVRGRVSGFYWPQAGVHQMRLQRFSGPPSPGGVIPRIHPPSPGGVIPRIHPPSPGGVVPRIHPPSPGGVVPRIHPPSPGGVIPRIPTHTILHPPGPMPRGVVGEKTSWWPQRQGGGDFSGSTHTILHPPGATPTIQYSGAVPTIQYAGATPTIPPGSVHTVQHSPGATPTIQHPGAMPIMRHPGALHRSMLLPSLPGHTYSNRPPSPVLPCFRPTSGQPGAVTRPIPYQHQSTASTKPSQHHQSASEQHHTEQLQQQQAQRRGMSQLQQISQVDFTTVSAERYLGVEERTIEYVENNPLLSPYAHLGSSPVAHQRDTQPHAQHDRADSQAATTSQQMRVAASTPQSTGLELHTVKESSSQNPAREREEKNTFPPAQEAAESVVSSIARPKPVYATPHSPASCSGLTSPGSLSTEFSSSTPQEAVSAPVTTSNTPTSAPVTIFPALPRTPPSAALASPVASESRRRGVKRTPTAVKRKPRTSGGTAKKQRQKPPTTHSEHSSWPALPTGSVDDCSLMVSYPMKALMRGDVEISEQVVEVTESELTDVQLYVDFAKHFKAHHLALGYSLEDIIQQVSIRYGKKVPLQCIQDFEDLLLRKEEFIPLMSVLNKWVKDTAQASGSSSVPTIMSIPATSIYPQRTRRQKTMVSTSMTLKLEEEFSKKRTQTQSELQKLALHLGVEKEYVRSWFCNRRKKEKCLGKRPARKQETYVASTSLIPEVAVDIGSSDDPHSIIKIPSEVYDITVEVPSIHPRDRVNWSDSLHYTMEDATAYTLPQRSEFEWHIFS